MKLHGSSVRKSKLRTSVQSALTEQAFLKAIFAKTL